MNGNFEELLRDSMEWFAGNVHVPPGMAGKAHRRHRRRRLAARAAVAAGTAIVCAAAVIAATGGARGIPGLHPGAGRAVQAQTTADILKRAERAASTRSLIMEISTPEQVVTTKHPGGQPARSFVPRSVQWSYRNRSRSEIFAAYLRRHGQPGASNTDTANSPLHRSAATLKQFTQTAVNYSDRTWSRGAQLTGGVSGSPGTACDLVKHMTDPLLAGELFFASPLYIHAALACGGLSAAGRARVDGAAAIKLTGTGRLMKLPLTVYVSPATYLLVRVVIGGLRQDYRWLAPTPAHLAMLQVRIPPGFRHVKNASGPPF